MTELPDGTRGKILAAAIAVLALGVFYFAAVSPLLSLYADTSLEIGQRRQVAARYESAVRDLPHLQDQAKAWRNKAGSGLFLEGATDALAAANLQTKLKSLIEDSGAKLASAQTLPGEVQGDFRRVGVRISFSGDLTLVTTVLAGIEAPDSTFAVNDLELRTAGDSDGDNGPMLQVAMDVYGFRSR